MSGEATTNEANGIMSFNENWNSSVQGHNEGATDRYNNLVKTANFEYSAKKTKDQVEQVGAGAMGGVNMLKTGANAMNFDSEVAGFGKGKGFSGYFNPYTQGQMLKGRMKYAQGRVGQALGSDAELPKTAKELGMSQMTARGNIATAPVKSGKTAQELSEMTDGPEKDIAIAQEGNKAGLVQAGKGVYKTPALASKDVVETAGANVEADKSMVKAGGGMYQAGEETASGLAGAGTKSGIMRKALTFGTDMAPKQIGAIADVAGKGLGIFGAADAIYDRANGSYAKDNALQKAGNTGDMIAGGLDMLSIAIPVLAPVAAVASIASAGMDMAGAFSSKTSTIAKGKAKELASYQSSGASASVSSQGKIGAQQQSSY